MSRGTARWREGRCAGEVFQAVPRVLGARVRSSNVSVLLHAA